MKRLHRSMFLLFFSTLFTENKDLENAGSSKTDRNSPKTGLMFISCSCSTATQSTYHHGNMQLRLDASKEFPCGIRKNIFSLFKILFCALGIAVYFQANAKHVRFSLVVILSTPCFDEFRRNLHLPGITKS